MEERCAEEGTPDGLLGVSHPPADALLLLIEHHPLAGNRESRIGHGRRHEGPAPQADPRQGRRSASPPHAMGHRFPPAGRLAQPWREDRSIWRAGGRPLKSVEKRTPPCGRLIRSFTRREVWQRGAVGVRQPRWQSDPLPLLRLILGSQIRQEARLPATPEQHFNAACVYFYLFARAIDQPWFSCHRLQPTNPPGDKLLGRHCALHGARIHQALPAGFLATSRPAAAPVLPELHGGRAQV